MVITPLSGEIVPEARHGSMSRNGVSKRAIRKAELKPERFITNHKITTDIYRYSNWYIYIIYIYINSSEFQGTGFNTQDWDMLTEIQHCQDSLLELKATTGRFGSQKLTLKLMKSKKKRWYKASNLPIIWKTMKENIDCLTLKHGGIMMYVWDCMGI